jgi:hypothetical protein
LIDDDTGTQNRYVIFVIIDIDAVAIAPAPEIFADGGDFFTLSLEGKFMAPERSCNQVIIWPWDIQGEGFIKPTSFLDDLSK